MSTKFLSPGWRMPRNANQGKNTNYSLSSSASNNAINFNYTDEFMSGQNPWTLSLWILWTSQPVTYKGYFFKGQSTSRSLVALYGDGAAIKFMCQGDDFFIPTFQTPSSVTVNKWYNLTITYDGNLTIKAYVDNTLDVTHTLGSPLSIGSGSGTNYFQLFQYNGSTSLAPTNARLSDLSIFDYALSPSQITTLYGDSTNGLGNPMALPSPPKAYYPLDTSAWNGNFLAENNAIGDYVFNFDYGGGDKITSNINQSNTGGKFTVSIWANSASQLFRLTHGATNRGGFLQINNKPIVYLSNNYFLYFNANTAQTDGKWHHWVVFVDTTNITNSKVWVDKVQITQNYGDFTGSANSFTTGLELSNFSSGSNLGFLSNMMYFTDYEIDQTNVDKLYNYGSPLKSTATLTQTPNAWYKLDASEVYNGSEWEINQASSFWKNSIDFNLTYSSANKAYIQCANTTNLNLTGAMTLSAWMKGDQLGGGNYNGLGTQGSSTSRGYGLLRGTNFAYFSISDNGSSHRYVGSPANTWRENEWNHVVGVFDPNSRFEVYVNGVFSAAGPNYAQQTSTNPFQIGNRGDGEYFYNWLGQLSNVSIWNTALSNGGVSVGSVAGGEIATLYNGGEPLQDLLTGPQNNNLLSWWKLDNITTGIQDSKGTNNGTIVTLGNGSVSTFSQSVSTLNGESSGMNQSNLVQSNLQTVAPYSKYAMSFDASSSDYINCGNNSSLQITGSITLSAWINTTQTTNGWIIAKDNVTNRNYALLVANVNNTMRARFYIVKSGTVTPVTSTTINVGDGNWHNVVGVNNGTDIKIYVDGILESTNNGGGGTIDNNTVNLEIGRRGDNQFFFDGSISNTSIWNTDLTSTQVLEIYNEGLPGNLNSHSAYSNLVSWWQLGENSSFDGNNWIVADEKGTNNGNSTGMPIGALVNGVGTTANGVSTNMAEGNLLGNAPYSTANAISSGMAVTARGTDVP